MTRSGGSPVEGTAPSRWRTGDLPAPLLALAYLLFVAAVLALASTGSTVSVVGIAVLMGLVVAVLYLWSDAD